MSTETISKPPTGRLAIGAGIFGFGMICPVFVPLVAASPLPTSWKAVLSGVLLLGLPEVFALIAVAVLGKPGFAYLKDRIFRILKNLTPAQHVGRTRYRSGLVLFVLPILLGWLGPYALPHFPGFAEHAVALNVGGDIMLLTSLILLGGDFWDKLCSLFVYDAVASFPRR